MKTLFLSKDEEGAYHGSVGAIEVLVRPLKNKWCYTLLERTYNGGWGRHGSAPKLGEMMAKLSQHLNLSGIRVFLVLENS
tara:strand:+ start:99 stop:338 length:240 start_codon:yes stop_codon:yes gene_type:complete